MFCAAIPTIVPTIIVAGLDAGSNRENLAEQ